MSCRRRRYGRVSRTCGRSTPSQPLVGMAGALVGGEKSLPGTRAVAGRRAAIARAHRRRRAVVPPSTKVGGNAGHEHDGVDVTRVVRRQDGCSDPAEVLDLCAFRCPRSAADAIGAPPTSPTSPPTIARSWRSTVSRFVSVSAASVNDIGDRPNNDWNKGGRSSQRRSRP